MPTLLIWGAHSAIAGATATLFTQHGWTVVGVQRPGRSHHSAFHSMYECDFVDAHAVNHTILLIAQEYGSEIDMLLYAAGTMFGRKLADTTVADWQRVIGDNLTAAHHITTSSLALLSPNASMYYLTAYSEKIQLPGIGAYAVAKAGLEAYVTVLSKEERQKRVVNVRMGAIDTPLWESAPFKLPRGAHDTQFVAQGIWDAMNQQHRGTLDL
ncbi:MAG: SDR family oxidoreductase [Chloroflexota bacterium]|jgi:NAD(P)-dependent dehydrogenase (short-subunit alcohol dehydrogenase family)